jgi:hypothetical protein
MASITSTAEIEKLASYQRCIQRICARWPSFLERRQLRLQQQHRNEGIASEKVAENILEDLFTLVLDWDLSDLNNQMEHADIVLTKAGVKYLLLETKRPGALAWNQHAVERALAQAIRYASEQRVTCVAISDGVMLYAANLRHGGLEDRIFVSLTDTAPQFDLWWLSVHGIYRPCNISRTAPLTLLPQTPSSGGGDGEPEDLLHPKYQLPASCFAYVGDPAHPATWKLPYRLINGSIDERRLPKAIQAILSNYRGVKVSGIPEEAIPAVLMRLARGVEIIGRMPYQRGDTAMIYQQLAVVLEQIK